MPSPDGVPCGYGCTEEAVNADCLRHIAQMSRPTIVPEPRQSPPPPDDRFERPEFEQRHAPWSDRCSAWLLTGFNLGLGFANILMAVRH